MLAAFVDRMIGIAKRARVLPSMPSRRINRTTAPKPPFYNFLRSALGIGREVIRTSNLPSAVKKAAAARLQYQSADALIKVVVKQRGSVSNYRNTSLGLVDASLTRKGAE